MNGLSAMGTGLAQFAGQAGLEAQKSALADQQAILADQLATTRESAGRVQAGQIAATAATQAQGATAANIATEQAGANTRNTATIAGTKANTEATIAAENQRQQNLLNQPPDLIRTLKFLGVDIPGLTPSSGGSAPATGATPSSAAPAANGTSTPTGAATPTPGASDTTSPSSAPAGASPQGASSGTAAQSKPNPLDNPLVAKALGWPQAGSEEALRRAVAADVNNDPAFKYQTAGQRAVETELRVNVAKGTMTSPATQQANAALIASYQMKPLDGFALTRQGGAETMAMVSKLNPDYQESRYPEINKAMSSFGPGKQGDIVRSLDVGVQHLGVIDQAAQNLGNTDIGVVNTVKNAFQKQFGYAPPTTFDGLKQIVSTEIEKAVAGGIGSAGDRERLQASLSAANSPAQLQAVTDGFRALMAGQLDGLKRQYENDTGFRSGPFAFENKLGPETIKALGSRSSGTGGQATGAAPSAPPSSSSKSGLGDATSFGDASGAPWTLSAPKPGDADYKEPAKSPPLPPGFRLVQ
jgi:hypothetical protein